jgi:hypothetical protein
MTVRPVYVKLKIVRRDNISQKRLAYRKRTARIFRCEELVRWQDGAGATDAHRASAGRARSGDHGGHECGAIPGDMVVVVDKHPEEKQRLQPVPSSGRILLEL